MTEDLSNRARATEHPHAALVDAARREMEGVRKTSRVSDVTHSKSRLADDSDAGRVLSASFPGYDMVREICRGGQGIVYSAFQKSTQRRVAIKVLREGPFAGPFDAARFQREVTILAGLKHPNIVAIHDSGTAAGNIYFVMDYIAGQPLDVYMDARRPLAGCAPQTEFGEYSVDDTLRLFLKIGNAVNAAQLSGVIHRDLKPGNIRVDPDGQPHVLDFGLAKIAEYGAPTGGSSAGMTQTGQFVGSLPWASPEQAEGGSYGIDIRTDVYSLGVILFQMLTGALPYDVRGNLRDVLDRIVNAEPIRPANLRPDINGEVETIVLKCLQKNRDRRYQSAGELAADVAHYLAGEPIAAKRDSLTYVLRKQIHKYRLPVAGAALLLIVIIFGFITSITYWRRAIRERDTSEQRRVQAETATNMLEEALKSADPDVAKARDFTVRELLDRFSGRLGEQLKDQPAVEARLRDAIGMAYKSLAEYDKAKVNLQAALSICRKLAHEDPRTQAELGDALNHLGVLLDEMGDYGAAEKLFRESLSVFRTCYGNEHREVATCLSTLGVWLYNRGDYQAAEPLLRESLAMRRKLLGEEHADTASSLHHLGSLLRATGRLDESQLMLEQAVVIRRKALGNDDSNLALSLSNLGNTLYRKEDFAGAEKLQREALAIERKIYPPEHPDIASTLNNLGALLRTQGEYEAAVPILTEALAIVRKLYGSDYPDHPGIASCELNLGTALLGKKDFAGALAHCREALAIRRRSLPPGHPDTAFALAGLGESMVSLKRFSEAEPLLRESVDIRRKALPGQVLTAQSMSLLGNCLMEMARYEEAERLLLDAFEILKDKPGPGGKRRGDCVERIARLYEKMERPRDVARWRAILPTTQTVASTGTRSTP